MKRVRSDNIGVNFVRGATVMFYLYFYPLSVLLPYVIPAVIALICIAVERKHKKSGSEAKRDCTRCNSSLTGPSSVAPEKPPTKDGYTKDKSVRAVSVILACVASLTAFCVASYALFQAKSALFCAEYKIDRYYTVSKATAYFVLSVVCVALTAACTVTVFLRHNKIFRSQQYYFGILFAVPSLPMLLIFGIAYDISALKGVAVAQVLLTLLMASFAVLTFITDPDRSRSRTVPSSRGGWENGRTPKSK